MKQDMMCFGIHNNMMQKLRKLNIFQLYKRLPFIIHKSIYLIPQRPYPSPQTPIFLKVSQKYRASNLIANFTRQKISNMNQIETAESRVESQLPHVLLSEYMNFYFLPSYKAYPNTITLRLYLMENQKKFSKALLRFDENNEQNEQKESAKAKLHMEQIKKIFQLESREVKMQYNAKSKIIVADHNSKMKIYERLFKIPEHKFKSPKRLTDQSKSDKQKQSEDSGEGKVEISQIKKEDIKDRQSENERLAIFLKDYKLSIRQFEAIKKICSAADKHHEMYKEHLKKKQLAEKIVNPKQKAKFLKKLKQQNYMPRIKKQEQKIFEELFSRQKDYNFKLDKFKQLYQQQLKQQKQQKQLKKLKKLKKENDVNQQESTNAKEIEAEGIVKEEGIMKQEDIMKAEYIVKEDIVKENIVKEEKQQAKEELIVSQPIKDHEIQKPIVYEVSPVKRYSKRQAEQIDNTIDNSLNEFAELSSELKDEDLDNLDILEEDYQVLKLQQQIKKLGLSKIPAKRTIY